MERRSKLKGMSRKREKVSSLLKEEVAKILKDAHDKRLTSVVITRIELSEDLKHAKVYFTTIPEGIEKEAEEALNNAKGYIRTNLLKRLDLKFVPQLTFKFDKELKSLEKIWEKL